MSDNDQHTDSLPLETHPWPPFIPDNAKVLIMGTFPPKSKRWSMDFYYPNAINDFWRMIGVIFFDDKDALWDASAKKFKLEVIKRLLTQKGIALNDTGAAVRRLKDNASDKFLEIVRPVDLDSLLARMPDCRVIATTGEKAASVIAELTSTPLPKMGEFIETVYKGRPLQIARMPSTSRAYPLALDKKVSYYRELFRHASILD